MFINFTSGLINEYLPGKILSIGFVLDHSSFDHSPKVYSLVFDDNLVKKNSIHSVLKCKCSRKKCCSRDSYLDFNSNEIKDDKFDFVAIDGLVPKYKSVRVLDSINRIMNKRCIICINNTECEDILLNIAKWKKEACKVRLIQMDLSRKIKKNNMVGVIKIS